MGMHVHKVFYVSTCLLTLLQQLSCKPQLTETLNDSDNTSPYQHLPCPSSTCSASSGYCHCDDLCFTYRDCCVDSNPTDTAKIDSVPKYQCIDNLVNGSVRGYSPASHWIIRDCERTPSSLKIDPLSSQSLRLSLSQFCTNGDQASKQLLTDTLTGRVYWNQYCAICNGVPENRWQFWSVLWSCGMSSEPNGPLSLRSLGPTRSLTDLRNGNNSDITLTVEEIRTLCTPALFELPLSNIAKTLPTYEPVRSCIPVIDTCPPWDSRTPISLQNFTEIARACLDHSINVVINSNTRTLYRNVACQLCNEPRLFRFRTYIEVAECFDHFLDPNGINNNLSNRPGTGSFAIVLDILGTGQTVQTTTSVRVTNTAEQMCGRDEVYDIYLDSCRPVYCLPPSEFNGFQCDPGLTIAVEDSDVTKSKPHNTSQNAGSDNHRKNGTTCTEPLPKPPLSSDSTSVDSCNNSLIVLNQTEFVNISTTTLHWIARGENVSIFTYTDNGLPIICANFSQTFSVEYVSYRNKTSLQYPEHYFILTITGLTIDMLAAIVYLITFSIFKEIRSFHTVLIVNLVICLLTGDIVFLIEYDSFIFCQLKAIALHYLFLARALWMTVVSLNAAKYFYYSLKCITTKNEDKSYRKMLLYILLGWLLPLTVVTLTVALNYTIPDSVRYGQDGACWIREPIAIAVVFAFPLALCIGINIICSIFMIAVITKVSRPSSLNSRGKNMATNLRVVLACMTVSGLAWTFGFIALTNNNLSWAWYLFIIFTSTQTLGITVTYLLTGKVLRFYANKWQKLVKFFKRKRMRKSRKITPTNANMHLYLKDSKSITPASNGVYQTSVAQQTTPIASP